MSLAITVLSGPAAVTEVRDALIAALSPGSTWIDMSTATPGIAGEIAEVARRRRIRTLDARWPVARCKRVRVAWWCSSAPR